MKVIIQRVTSAKVTIQNNGRVSGQIQNGLFLLLGIKKGDTQKEADLVVDKISKLRIMSDENQKMNLSVVDTKSQILLVSQFTLLANTREGNRPSFIDAEEPERAKQLYLYIKEKFVEKGLKVETGSFGDYMEIEAILDGPVTIVLEV